MSARRRHGPMGMSELLTDKNVIIYGGAGGLGAGVARVFSSGVSAH